MDDMTVKINRGEDSVKLWFLTVMTEDASTGRVLTAGYTQQMAEDTITMEYTFGDTEVQVTSVQSGKTHTSSLPPVSSHYWFTHSWPQTQGHRSLSGHKRRATDLSLATNAGPQISLWPQTQGHRSLSGHAGWATHRSLARVSSRFPR
jgi:hypothetical protein